MRLPTAGITKSTMAIHPEAAHRMTGLKCSQVKLAGIHCRDGGSFHGRLNNQAIRRPLLGILGLLSAGGIFELRLRIFSDAIEEALDAWAGDSALILTVWWLVDAVSV